MSIKKTIFLISGIRFTYKFVIPYIKTKQNIFFWFFFLNNGQSSHDFNKLVIKAKMHDKIYVYFFWSFLCCIKMQYDFLGFERLGRMHKNIFFLFSFFWQKLGIFNDVKVQSILIKNIITSARGNCKNPKPYFWKVFFYKKEKNEPGPAHPFWAGPTRLASA